jgi:cytidine deaminase
MKEIILNTRITMCQETELDETMQKLVEKAKEMTRSAYSPYSGFSVGAVALLEDGTMVLGNNQENAAYPSGMCAERTALYAANANYPTQPVVALALACYTKGHFTKKAGTPCGACRQVMLETEHRYGKPMRVVLYGDEECVVLERAADLLPLSFVAESLEG